MALQGAREMAALVRAIAGKLPTQIGRALYAEGEVDIAESQTRVPVDQGILRASGFVEPPVISGTPQTGTSVSVQLGYGGAASEYAFIVHEDLTAYHDDGEAKYLESVLNESEATLAGRLARRLTLERLARE